MAGLRVEWMAGLTAFRAAGLDRYWWPISTGICNDKVRFSEGRQAIPHPTGVHVGTLELFVLKGGQQIGLRERTLYAKAYGVKKFEFLNVRHCGLTLMS
jgi:hypothetical protein